MRVDVELISEVAEGMGSHQYEELGELDREESVGDGVEREEGEY